MRQINISVDDRVHDKLGAMARERGYSLSAYAKMLFDAAYAARSGKSGDLELDALVGCVLVLSAAKKDIGVIAAALKLQDRTVTRIISTFRKQFLEAA